MVKSGRKSNQRELNQEQEEVHSELLVKVCQVIAFRGAGNNKGFKKSDSSESKNLASKSNCTKISSSKITGRGGKRGGSILKLVKEDLKEK